MITEYLIGFVLVAQGGSPPVAWQVISEDGKLLAARDFRLRQNLANGKVLKGEHVYYTSDGHTAKSVTTSQKAHGAGLGQFDNQIIASGAWTPTVWAVLFRESSWRIPKLPPGATRRSQWIAVINSDKRGPNPNLGMRLNYDFDLAVVECTGPTTLIVTGRERQPRQFDVNNQKMTFTSLGVDVSSGSVRKRWDFHLEGKGGYFDSTGVLFEKDGRKYHHGPTGKTFLVKAGKSLAMANGRVVYVNSGDTIVRNLQTGKEARIKGFVARLVSPSGSYVLGASPGKPVDVRKLRMP